VRTSPRWTRLNGAEARLIVDSPALPIRPPHPAVTAITTAARGGALWLALSALEAVRPGGDRRAACHAALSVLVALAAGHAVKRMTPPRSRPEAPGGHARRTLPERPDSSSFPSSHAATASAFGAAVIARYRHRGVPLLSLPLVAIYSRVRARVHWPTDVLAGSAIGIATTAALAPVFTEPRSSGGDTLGPSSGHRLRLCLVARIAAARSARRSVRRR
jgi:membrane-associated phospholipid phosphatase